MGAEECLFFLFGPGQFVDCRTEVVVPSLSALFACAGAVAEGLGHACCYFGPILDA